MEQLTLLFYVYDTERRGSIDKWQVRTLARIFSKDASIKNEDLLTPELYGKLFQDSEIVKAKDFIEWASRPKAGKKMFVWWIYDLARCLFHGIAEYNKLSSPDSSNTVKKILSKRGRRKSSGKDAASRDHIVLSFLRERYNALEAALSKTGRPSEGKNGVGANEIDIDSIFSPPIPTKLLNIVFFYVDKSNVGVVDAAEFVSTIARLFTGTLEYQLEFLFKMFDKDDDAMLSFNEIISLIRCMAEIEEEFDAQKLESGLRPETVSQFRRALTKAAFGRTKATMLASKKHSLSELISLSVNHALQSKQDRRMSLQEWKVWSSQNSELFLFSQRSVQNAIEFARRRLSPVEEREMVKKALNAKQYSATKEREGQVWFIISKKWWQSWDRYTLEATNRKSMYEFSSEEKGSAANLSFKNDVSIGRDRPGKIDQTDILEEGSDKRLRTDISRQTHYAIISETIWKYLLSWYGGGPAIPRRVVKDENRLELEMYPITIRVCRVGENHERLTHCIEMSISRFYTILMLKQIASSQLGLRPKEIRLWDCRHSDPKMVMLLPTTKEVETRTVEQMGFIDGQEVLVEQRERSGRWPNVVDSNFLTALMDGLHEDLNRKGAGEYPATILEDDEDTTNMAELVKKLWGFSLHFVRHDGRGCSHCNWLTKCRGCLAMPYNDQMVPTLKNGSSFAIDWSESSLRAMKSDSQLQSFPRHESLHKCESYETKVLSIHQCMNRYISKEKLDGNDQVYCSKCKEHRDHRKQVTLFRPPPVLILHLKRFKFAYNRGREQYAKTAT
eukprot:g1054.t1